MPIARVPVAQNADSSANQVDEAARAIARGRLVVLPTETVYGLAADPESETSITRVVAFKGRAASRELTYHLADTTDLERLAPSPPPRVQRLLQRFWPGPVTVVLPGRTQSSVGLRVPAQEFTRAVIRRFGRPIYLTSVNRSGDPPLVDPDEIVARFGKELDVLYDAGRSPLAQPSTVVRVTGPALEVLREGVLNRDEVLRAASRLVLFVCTGNTCRSPMAEALARSEAARMLRVAPADLPARGLRFASAGAGTLDGLPASEGAVAALATLGIDLDSHRSRALTRALLAEAAEVYALAASHLERIEAIDPAAAARVQLLDPSGADVPDPFGGETADYEAARDQIRHALVRRLPEILARID